MAPRISASLVLFHSDDVIRDALRCLDQATTQVSVYLIDNSPEDHLAEKLQWNWPGITVLPQKTNVGFGRANNAVLPYLESDYHLMMNPDVTFPPELLSKMAAYMDAHPNIAILTPRVFNADGTEQFLPKKQISIHYLLGGLLEEHGGIFKRWREEFTLADTDVTAPVPVEFATGCFMFIRTAVFRELGGFDPRFFLYQEDSDLSRRVLAEGKGSIVYHPEMWVIHRWARENTRTGRGRRRQITSAFKYFLKWGFKW